MQNGLESAGTTNPKDTMPNFNGGRKSGSSAWFAGCAALLAIAVAGIVVVGAIGLLLILLLSFIGSAIPNLEGIAPVSSASSSFSEEYISGKRFSPNKIVVIDVIGIISSTEGSIYDTANSESICEQLRKAADEDSVKAIIVNLDTPGGEVTASDEIYHEIMGIRETTGKPVVAMMNSLAASGGYYVAVGCDRIVANKFTLTGSIGVIIESYNYSDLFNKVGLKSEVYKSGKMKDMLDGSRPRTEEERRLVQELVNSTYNEFVSVVSKGRNIPADTIKGTCIGDGRVFDGKQALDCKLVDSLGYFQDSVDAAAALAGIQDNYKLVRMKETFSFAKFLEGMNSSNASVQVSLPGADPVKAKLKSGRLYFLPPNL